MDCPRCHTPVAEATLRDFGGICPKCLLAFAGETDAPAFPNLEIVEMIGQGGMGVVYKALQKNLNRTVALKVLSPKLSEDPAFLERFTREAQALAQLNHPNIVAIHDSGVHDRVPFLVMEYVEGRSLRKLLQEGGITSAQVLLLIPQICDALQYAHSRGVVHRDIKPENILIDAAGRVKIADYGLAKLASAEDPRLTRSGMVMGTPHYMAPEQIENSSQVDHRADIYSLGVIFYEMLTGGLPLGRFKAPSEKSGSDARLDPVVLRTLEKEPSDRYQSAGDVKDQIARLEQTPKPRRRPPYVVAPRIGGLKRAAFIIANLGGLALAGGFALSLTRERTLMGLAEILTVIGWALLLAALVLGALLLAFRAAASILDPDRKEAPTRRWWTVLTATLGVAIFLFIASLIPGPPPKTSPSTATLLESEFLLEDAWPGVDEFPPEISIFGTQTESDSSTQFLNLKVADTSGVRQIRRLLFEDGGLQLLGIQFRSREYRQAAEGLLQKQGLVGSYLRSGGSALLVVLRPTSILASSRQQSIRQVLDRNIDAAIATYKEPPRRYYPRNR